MSGSDPAGEPEPPSSADLRLAPLAAAAWGGAWWGTQPGPVPLALVAVTALLAVLWLCRTGRVALAAAVVTVLLMASGGAWLRHRALVDGPVAELAAQRAVVQAVVVVDSDVVLRPRKGVVPEQASAPAHLVTVRARGALLRQRLPVTVRATGTGTRALGALPAGSTIQVEGRLAPARPGDPLVGELTLRGPPVLVAPPGWSARAVNSLRSGLRRAMGHSNPAQAGLLPSLVVGDTSGLDPSLVDDFKATALTHLTAVSGTNLTLTLAFLLWAARWCGVRGWWLRGVGLAGVVAFVTVCRAEPSVLRAAAMGLVALAGLGMGGGRGRGLRHLCAGVWLLLLVDPWLARSLGFALSALATGGILWFARPWSTHLGRWCPAWLAEAVCVPLAAQVVTQPVVTSISGTVSVVGLVANALAEPFVGPATVTGLVAALVAPVSPWLGGAAGWLAGWIVQPVIWVATHGAALPAATWRWPAGPGMLLLLSVSCLALAWGMPLLLARRWVCLLLAVALVVAGLRSPQPLGWPGPWQVAFCDVGQGDATVLRAAPDQAILIDTGPDARPTVDCLHQLGVRGIALVVLTHYHDDHIGGLAGVLAGFPVGRLMVNPVASPAAGARRVRELAAARGVPVEEAALGEHLRAGAVDLTVVGVGATDLLAAPSDGENSAENDTSIVSVLQVGGLRVVVGGDVEPPGQQHVVAAGWQPHLSILKMPHHGSSRQDEAFWCDSGASLAVASAGYHNDYGHPARAALQLAAHCGMGVARTDLEGTITAWVQDGSLQVRRQRDGPP